jgi:DNA-binding response OmpR family regulator
MVDGSGGPPTCTDQLTNSFHIEERLTYIRYLRRKLSIHGQPDPITTFRGSGYTIDGDA